MKKIKILSLLAIVGMLGISQIAFAANSTLSVSPASLNSTAGKTFNVSVQLDPAGNKVCVVKGTLNLNNLSCQAVTVADGLMIQTNPSCSSPSFTVGIPKCSTAVENILSVSVKGTQAGQANLSITGAKVIGVGVDVPFTSQSGVYQIAAVPTTKTQTTTITQTAQQATNTAPVVSNTAPITQTAAVATASSSGNAWMWIILVIVMLVLIGFIYSRKSKPRA